MLKPIIKQVVLVIESDIYDQLIKGAKKGRRSMSKHIEWIVHEYTKEQIMFDKKINNKK